MIRAAYTRVCDLCQEEIYTESYHLPRGCLPPIPIPHFNSVGGTDLCDRCYEPVKLAMNAQIEVLNEAYRGPVQ